jgi:hypothetical protein
MLTERVAESDSRPSWFVGRTAELAKAEALLDNVRPGMRLLLVDGPGGVGKSALLFELARRARRRGWAVRRIEGSGMPMSTLGVDADVNVASPLVTLVDDWNGMAPERFLGGPATISSARIVVLASRRAAPIGATSWATRGVMIERLSLAPLSGDEAEALLTARGVSDVVAHELAARLGRYPLVLALAAELHVLRGDVPTCLADAPELVVALLRRLVEATDDAGQRQALEALATDAR